LVGCLDVWKGRVELALPLRVGGEGDAGSSGTLGLESEHVRRDVEDSRLRGGLLANPRFSAEPCEGETGPSAAHVFLNEVDARRGNEDADSRVELDLVRCSSSPPSRTISSIPRYRPIPCAR